MNTRVVPAVALADLSGDAPGRAATLRWLDVACQDWGALLLRVDAARWVPIRRLESSARTFFDAAPTEKLRWHSRHTARGYSAPGTESLAATRRDPKGGPAPVDVKEAFAADTDDLFSRTVVRDDGRHRIRWPDQPADLRTCFQDAFRVLHGVASVLVTALADSLGVPPATVRAAFESSADFLRVIRYPASVGPLAPGQTRAGAHTDFGAVALIGVFGATSGLQVAARDGRWVDIDPEPDEVVVTLGDVMPVWTSGRWRAALHQVVSPAGPAGCRESVVFFHNPRETAAVKPLDSPVGTGVPVHTAGQALADKTRRQRVGD